jgi:IS5 family transposase
MVDATLIDAPRGRPRPDGTSTRDPEASFTRRRFRSHHGFKGHIAADRSGIVTDYRFGTAKEHDSRRIDSLTANERVAVLADSAYDDAARRAGLRARGVLDLISFRRPGNRPLREGEIDHNRLMMRLRCRVEHPFAMIKHLMGYRRVRYRGIDRNAFDFAMLLAAANLRRSLSMPPPA